ncbi:hypothetical protein E1B28_011254 [Marasmius oreades]|uniref:Uncharacterized protein n=1 Tax=Marasmius oreades TaxID=181124 RepID=A0A9P7RU77_9AGAR|nr:uncharacterized protein E1B28_011254 [Marasmius oreades]KAG7089587.1 hypothetical protein E1B28_011254 [Marasmius oreades]
MKVFTTFAFGAFFFASSASAFPIVRRKEVVEAGKVVMMNNNTQNDDKKVLGGNKAGALYFITNENDGNFVVSADIGDDGKLGLRQAISTGGAGVHGNDGNKNNPGPLFSAGSVQVSAASKMLATVNSGSNTLSLFSIDEQDPAVLTRVGSTVGSGGEFPVSVAFNSKGDKLCALNGGEVNGVSCFKVDKENGLTPLSGTNRALGLNQTTPATGAPGSASQLIFSEDDKQLITSIKGIPGGNATNGRGTVGALAIFEVADDGSLSKDFKVVAPPEKGLAPFGMAIVPNKTTIIAVADPAVGLDVFDLSQVEQGANKSVATAIDKQQAVGWIVRSPTTENFLLSDFVTGLVTEVKVGDDLKGSVVSETDLGSDSGTIDNAVATVKGKDFLYVMSSKAKAIDVLALDKTAKPSKIQRQDLAEAAKAAQLTISSANLSGLAAFVKA